MTTSIAEYYLDELSDWKSAIDLYLEEIDDAEKWLQSILHFDSVPALAAKVEHHLNQLSLSKENLHRIISYIQASQQKFYKDRLPIGNDLVTEDAKAAHKQLRTAKHNAEKEHLDVKYSCDEFLATAVEMQNKTKSNG